MHRIKGRCGQVSLQTHSSKSQESWQQVRKAAFTPTWTQTVGTLHMGTRGQTVNKGRAAEHTHTLHNLGQRTRFHNAQAAFNVLYNWTQPRNLGPLASTTQVLRLYVFTIKPHINPVVCCFQVFNMKSRLQIKVDIWAEKQQGQQGIATCHRIKYIQRKQHKPGHLMQFPSRNTDKPSWIPQAHRCWVPGLLSFIKLCEFMFVCVSMCHMCA